MRFDAVVFDFDGTVARTHMGVVDSARHALRQMGRPVPDDDTMLKFLGPPLHYSFSTYAGLSDADADVAVEMYRAHYGTVGLYEAELYPGFMDLLKALKQAGAWVGIASGKPEIFLTRVAAHLGVTDYADALAGPLPENKSADKTNEVLRALPKGADLERCVMVGDRVFDIEAGRRLGMATAGVLYGYGTRAEFEKAQADHIASSVEELAGWLLS